MTTATNPIGNQLTNYAEAQTYGREVSFLANVILSHHSNPARKLAGLVRLLRRGHECRIAQFNLDVLLIDGERRDWNELENVK